MYCYISIMYMFPLMNAHPSSLSVCVLCLCVLCLCVYVLCVSSLLSLLQSLLLVL
jgi:hypothetical protein